MRAARHIGLSSAAAVALAACSGGAPTSQALLQRIERVENGLPPAVVARGAEMPRTTIGDVLARYHVPGVSVAVINDGRLEWAKGYGVREVGGAPVDTATLFLAGHIGQGVAALATLKLVEDGLVGLDQNVNERLASWHVPENEFTAAEKVTLRRVLSHTSGLSVPTMPGYSSADELPTIEQMLDGVAPASNEPIRVLLTPGSRQRYSLGGYVVLQRLLEDITGSPYSDFVRATVLEPLDMHRSFHSQPLTEALAANAASGYEPTNEPVAGRWRVYPQLAALGMWTTPSDLARLAIEMQRSFAGESNGIISQASVAEMLSQQFENRGLGFEVGGEGEWRSFRLEGHGNNYLSELFAFVSQGMGAVVMTNSSNGHGVTAHILRGIAAEYGWADFVPQEVEVARLPDDVLAELEGRYSYRGRDRVLAVEGGRILERISDRDREEELLPLSADLLVSVSFGYRYAVDRDATGSITGLTLVLQGTRLFTYERVD
ncbi:MAG: beta-lactamase family protein [Gemmatimonadota bacterium]|nr:MAG: beta-lactamase family protein [Gemmatimonadota bacterium]